MFDWTWFISIFFSNGSFATDMGNMTAQSALITVSDHYSRLLVGKFLLK